MAIRNMDTRIQNKHDLEVNWIRAVNFKPLAGELIIYDKEVDKDGNILTKIVDGRAVQLLPEGRTVPYTYERIKIGNGTSTVNELPFIATIQTVNAKTGITATQAIEHTIDIGLDDTVTFILDAGTSSNM